VAAAWVAHALNVWIASTMSARQMQHRCSCVLHSMHTATCAHGSSTVLISAMKQTLHRESSLDGLDEREEPVGQQLGAAAAAAAAAGVAAAGSISAGVAQRAVESFPAAAAA